MKRGTVLDFLTNNSLSFESSLGTQPSGEKSGTSFNTEKEHTLPFVTPLKFLYCVKSDLNSPRHPTADHPSIFKPSASRITRTSSTSAAPLEPTGPWVGTGTERSRMVAVPGDQTHSPVSKKKKKRGCFCFLLEPNKLSHNSSCQVNTESLLQILI